MSSQVTKAVPERALADEMTGHLGYEKYDPAGRAAAITATGPRPRQSSPTSALSIRPCRAIVMAVFEPQIMCKGQTRLEGFSEPVIAPYARGMTTQGTRAHMRAIFGSRCRRT